MTLLDAAPCGLYDRRIMRIFHLADLHLGKSIFEHDLIEDQRHALDVCVAAVASEKPACLIVSGDVFDRAVPSPEAVTLLGNFVASIQEIDPAITLAMIPGNHDSAARLSFLSSVLSRAGVHIAASADACDKPVLIERDGERMRLWLIPFLTPGAFSGVVQPELIATMRSQSELFDEAMKRIQQARSAIRRKDGTSDVLVCHVFARGSLASGSEREFLGNAELVDGSLFDTFDYVALGHLHRPQSVGRKGRYPGSMLAYTFGETGVERGFLSVELKPGVADAELRPIKPLRRMIRIQGSYDGVLKDAGFAGYHDDYVELLLDDATAVLNPMDALRKRFPYILSLRQAVFERPGPVMVPDDAPGEVRSTVADDFIAFHREMFGSEPSTEDSALFAELYGEASREAQ